MAKTRRVGQAIGLCGLSFPLIEALGYRLSQSKSAS